MTIQKNNDKLVIELTGRIDTNNASEVEKEIMEAIDADKGMEISFDAEKLSYISSAGLRVLMKVLKMSGKPVEVVNVSRDVYDIFETTGFTELMKVKRAYRTISVDGLEVIGKGFFGTVYRIDAESIVKVYKGKDSIPMIENEKRMAQKAFLSGIPTAISYDIVKVGEDYGSVFELLNARTYHELVQKKEKPVREIISGYTDLLKLIHRTSLSAGTFPSYRKKYLDYLEIIKKHLTESHYKGLLSKFTDMEEETTVVHGDAQMKNVMLVGDEPMLIDMDTLGLGNPVFDLAGLYVTYQLFEEDEPSNSMDFLQMSQEMVDEIWKLIIETYFNPQTDNERQIIEDKIALVAVVRFLYLIESTDLKNSDLGKRRIEHSREHIDELLKAVDTLALNDSEARK